MLQVPEEGGEEERPKATKVKKKKKVTKVKKKLNIMEKSEKERLRMRR